MNDEQSPSGVKTQNEQRPDPAVELAASTSASYATVVGSSSNLPQQEQPVVDLTVKRPMWLSTYLDSNEIYTEENLSLFQAKADSITQMNSVSKEQKVWLRDYITSSARLRQLAIVPRPSDIEQQQVATVLKRRESNSSSSTDLSECSARGEPSSASYSTPLMQDEPVNNQLVDNDSLAKLFSKLKVSERIIKPEMFDGDKPSPRKWIDSVDQAKRVNGWSDKYVLRHFPAYLQGAAQDWYATIAQRKLRRDPTWQGLREAFMRHYPGENDKASTRRHIERCRQGDHEKAANFIPRLLHFYPMVEPEKPEEELVEVIRPKLRKEYQEHLAMHDIYTLERLNDLCHKVETNVHSVRLANEKDSRTRSNPRMQAKRDDQVRSRDESESGSGKARRFRVDKPKQICSRCDRLGHEKANCWTKSKLDGTALTDPAPAARPANYKNPARGSDQSVSSVAVQSARSVRDSEAKPQIRAAGISRLSTICAAKAGTAGICSAIFQDIRCNGQMLKGLVDTGAYVSTVAAEAVRHHNWQVEPTDMKLHHAAGEQLNCLGKISAELEIVLNKRAMSVRHDLVVVEQLCSPIIIGIDLLRLLKINIRTDQRQPLAFQKGVFKKGLRVSEQTVLPSRNLKFVRATVQFSAALIATMPFGFDNSVMLANSLNQVENGRTEVLLANLDNCDIMLKPGQQVASFEQVENPEECAPTQVFLGGLIQINHAEETIRVGDNLSGKQVEDLRRLVNECRNAFALGGQIGSTDLAEHSIALLDPKPFIEKARRHPPQHVAEAKRQVRDMLKEGIIEPSSSPWCSEYVMVRKKTNDCVE